MLLEKDSPRPLVFKNGLTFKNPIIGIGDIGINVGGLGIYESTKKLGRVDISIKSVSGRGVKKGGIWRTLRVTDQRHGGQGHS